MIEGLLWFDDDPGRTLAEKVVEAMERYRERFGVNPNLCLVHPDELSATSGKEKGAEKAPDGIRLQASKTVLPHHLLVGVAPPTRAAK